MNVPNHEKRNFQLAKAREKIAKSGKSPRELGNESRKKLLNWIYYWGFTTANLGQILLERTSAGYLQKLSKQNWLVSTKTLSGTPKQYYTLTETGLQETEHFSDRLWRYVEIDPYKVDQSKLRHSIIVQKSTLLALHSGLITDFESERMLANEGDKLGVKRPDALWITNGGLRLGIEVELSAKWKMDLDNFILGIIRSLKSTTNEGHGISRFVIISDSQAIIRRYSDAMQPGQPLSIWEKNERKRWVIQRTLTVPDWLIQKIDFKYIEY